MQVSAGGGFTAIVASQVGVGNALCTAGGGVEMNHVKRRALYNMAVRDRDIRTQSRTGCSAINYPGGFYSSPAGTECCFERRT